MERSSGYSKRTVLGCLAVLIALIVCLSVTLFGMDRLCYASLSNRLPIYPGAEIRVQRYNLFAARGMGETYMELYSPDEPDTVSRWYGQQVGGYIRESSRNRDFIYALARSQYTVRRADEGEGSLIQLYGTCAQ